MMTTVGDFRRVESALLHAVQGVRKAADAHSIEDTKSAMEHEAAARDAAKAAAAMLGDKTEVNISLGKAKIEGTPAEVGRAIRDAMAQAAPEPMPNPDPATLAEDALRACLGATKRAVGHNDGPTALAMAQAAQALAEVRSKL